MLGGDAMEYSWITVYAETGPMKSPMCCLDLEDDDFRIRNINFKTNYIKGDASLRGAIIDLAKKNDPYEVLSVLNNITEFVENYIKYEV